MNLTTLNNYNTLYLPNLPNLPKLKNLSKLPNLPKLPKLPKHRSTVQALTSTTILGLVMITKMMPIQMVSIT